MLEKLLTTALRGGLDSATELALQHTTATPEAYHLRYVAPGDALAALIELRPKIIKDLLVSEDGQEERNAWIIKQPHKPSVSIANRVATCIGMHGQESIDYVLKHGKKVALRELLERKVYHLSVDEMRQAQETLLTKYGELAFPMSYMRRTDYREHKSIDWLAQIESSVDLLESTGTETLKSDPVYEFRVVDILLAASAAGVTYSQELADAFEVQPATAEELVVEALSHTGGVWGRHYDRHLALAFILNPEVVKEFRKLSSAHQYSVHHEFHTWNTFPLESWDGRARRAADIGDPTPISDEIVLSLVPEVDLGWGTSPALARRVLELAGDRFGNDAGRWNTLESLLPNWSGTVGELLDMAEVVSA